MPKTKFSKEEQQEHDPYEVIMGTQPLENAPFKWRKVSGYERLSHAIDDWESMMHKLSTMTRDDMMEEYDAPRVDLEVIDKTGKVIFWFGCYRKEWNQYESKEIKK